MPRATWIQTNFNGGEWSPVTYGRVDLKKYNNALATCLNYVPMIQGGLTRRPGTKYIAAAKNAGKKAKLVRFEFSTTQAYILEFGDQYVRFYTNDGQLLSGGSPYEVATPYLEADLAKLKFTQSADVLYIAHPSYAPRKLVRSGALSWALSTISFVDGPYLNTNGTATTLTSSATSGSATVTASSTTGINDGAGFKATDVGRMIRLKDGSSWGWGKITAYTSSTQVTVSWTTAVGTSATATWRLGVWSDTTGYPAAVVFHEDRLVWGGPTSYPQRLDGSKSSDYETYSPSAADGTVAASNAYAFSLNSNTVNAIQWMQSDEKGLLVGTSGGEWIVRASSLTEALSPTNVQAKQVTRYGSAEVPSVQVGKAVVYVQRNSRRVRELAYSFQVDGFVSPDVSLIGEHITAKSVVQMAFTAQPQSLIWAAMGDGSLACFSYDKDQEVAGWSKHTLGGTGAFVESVAAIPSPDGTRDQLWLLVRRTVNGSTVRYVELMNKFWETGDAVSDAIYMDCAATYSGSPTTTVSGLTYLVGATVSVLADGSTHPDCVVNGSGQITLQRSASKVQVGLGYTSRGKTMRIEAGGADGTAQGKLKRIHRVIFRLWESIGLSLVGDRYTIDEPFRTSADLMDNAITPFTGDKRWAWEGSWDLEGQVTWEQTQPLPSNILSLVVQLETQDGG